MGRALTEGKDAITDFQIGAGGVTLDGLYRQRFRSPNPRRRIPDIDVWRAAALMTQCFRRDAEAQAAACADELLAAGKVEGCAMWRRITAAITQLQAVALAAGEAVH